MNPKSHFRAVIAPGLMISSPIVQLYSIPVLPSVISTKCSAVRAQRTTDVYGTGFKKRLQACNSSYGSS